MAHYSDERESFVTPKAFITVVRITLTETTKWWNKTSWFPNFTEKNFPNGETDLIAATWELERQQDQLFKKLVKLHSDLPALEQLLKQYKVGKKYKATLTRWSGKWRP